jgi:hypothetical protein
MSFLNNSSQRNVTKYTQMCSRMRGRVGQLEFVAESSAPSRTLSSRAVFCVHPLGVTLISKLKTHLRGKSGACAARAPLCVDAERLLQTKINISRQRRQAENSERRALSHIAFEPCPSKLSSRARWKSERKRLVCFFLFCSLAFLSFSSVLIRAKQPLGSLLMRFLRCN